MGGIAVLELYAHSSALPRPGDRPIADARLALDGQILKPHMYLMAASLGVAVNYLSVGVIKNASSLWLKVRKDRSASRRFPSPLDSFSVEIRGPTTRTTPLGPNTKHTAPPDSCFTRPLHSRFARPCLPLPYQ